MTKNVFIIRDKNLKCDVNSFLANNIPEAKRHFVEKGNYGLQLYYWFSIDLEDDYYNLTLTEIQPPILLVDYDVFAQQVNDNDTVELE